MNKEKLMYHAHPDVILIGGGIMSVTLGILIKQLFPEKSITIFERLPVVAGESTDAWNNAGTGHAAYCELNYTPQKEDGSIDCKKALKVSSAFELSKQFWSFLVEQNCIGNPDAFINKVPHISFVWGEENVQFLKRRMEALSRYALFGGMEFTEEYPTLMQWIPLVMEGRKENVPCAATKMEDGTDVDFGALTRAMMQFLTSQADVTLYLEHDVKDIERTDSGEWRVTVKALAVDEKRVMTTKHVFIGAGGASLPLLEKSDIQEAEGYGGFPVSGQWLRCLNPAIIEHHGAKVYGKASVGTPPMSVPHLDTRIIAGKKELLFGPFAGFSTKFLKNGSYLDLAFSLEWDNIIPMVSAGWHNRSLTKYLIEQASQSMEDRIEALRAFVPNAQFEDWELVVAGQRVQVIRKDEEEGGVLEFGTEIVSSADGTLSVLLGASPGASTAVEAMLEVLKRAFPEKMKSEEGEYLLTKMLPSYGKDLTIDEQLCEEVKVWTTKALKL